MSSNLHSISISHTLDFTSFYVFLQAMKMLHQGAAGAFSWSICCSQWLNHCVKVISISVVFFLLSCFSVLQVMALFRSVELPRPGDSGWSLHSRALSRKLASASWSLLALASIGGAAQGHHVIFWPWLNPPRGHHWHVAGSKNGSICILSIIVFSCQAPCQASFCPLPLGLKFFNHEME